MLESDEHRPDHRDGDIVDTSTSLTPRHLPLSSNLPSHSFASSLSSRGSAYLLLPSPAALAPGLLQKDTLEDLALTSPYRTWLRGQIVCSDNGNSMRSAVAARRTALPLWLARQRATTRVAKECERRLVFSYQQDTSRSLGCQSQV
jgi:hypothetical protein